MGIEDVGTTLEEALNRGGPNLTRARFEEVFQTLDPAKAEHLNRFILGSISWSTDLGRPDTPTMAEGFTIIHEYWSVLVLAVGDGRVKVIEGWRTGGTVSAMDAPDSDGRHQVTFVAAWHDFPPNRISVDFAPVPWRDRAPLAGVRSLRPHSVLVDRPSRARFVEFEVIGIPHIEIERAGILAEG